MSSFKLRHLRVFVAKDPNIAISGLHSQLDSIITTSEFVVYPRKAHTDSRYVRVIWAKIHILLSPLFHTPKVVHGFIQPTPQLRTARQCWI